MSSSPGSTTRFGEPGRFAASFWCRLPITCAVNRTLVESGWHRVISVGQLVPHEIAGIANYRKNILVGLGGPETISKSHYMVAGYGLERVMGRIDSPMRRLLSWMERDFLAALPITYLMTVRGTDGELTLDALEQALWARDRDGELIHHSDRGSQYLAIRYTERLAEEGIVPSVGSLGTRMTTR